MAKIQTLKYRNQAVSKVLYGENLSGSFKTLDYIVTGLSENTSYQIRPYMIINGSVVYGNVLNFRTASSSVGLLSVSSKGGNYSFMAVTSSSAMSLYMREYTGNYISNYRTQASFVITYDLSTGASEYGLLYGPTGVDLVIGASGCRRVSMPAVSKEVTKIITNDGNVWTKDGSDGGYTPAVGPEYVDLGLSVKWAKWNMGANSTKEYGGYYGWGDPTGTVVSYQINKYAVGNTSTSIAGNPKYDIATAKWGNGWRLPTKAEFEEMIAASNERWTYDTSDGIKKYIATFPNGRTLEIPYDGYMNSSCTEKVWDSHGYYWTADANTADITQQPYAFHMNGPRARSFPNAERCMHLMIRPVYDDGHSGGGGGDTPVTPEVPSNAVDLGLYSGNLWATYNVGATSETESGVYVAWGELNEKISEGYYKENYAYWSASNPNYGGYSTALGTNIAGTEYDIAHVRWGGTWHMPTDSDIKELRDQCTWVQETRRGVVGYKVTGPNGNSIFLPFAGYYNGKDWISNGIEGNYWCSTMYLFAHEYQMGYALSLAENTHEISRYSRKGGLTIRPCMPRVE